MLELLPWLVAMGLLILLSGFCSSSEAALFLLSPQDQRSLREGSRAEQRVAKLLADPDRLLTAVLFCNLVVNVAYFAIASISAMRLQQGGRRARETLAAQHDLCGLVFESDAMHRLVTLAINVGASNAPVLVTGPSGAGKEKVAEIVQANSPRTGRPFVKVNVGALPEELMEAELFGAEAGAYTGSKGLRVGRFEAADRGTLFLDEIDALSLAGQVKLLRVVQTGEYQRLGSSATRRADVRIISASNANLEQAVAAGRFREDLYYRLNVLELVVPPLAQRPEDVLPLARYFLSQAARDHGRDAPELSQEAAEALVHHRWPGNVRELQNRMQRATLTAGDVIDPGDLELDTSPRPAAPSVSPGPLDGERRRLEQALVDADGVVARAAEALGLSRQALYRKMDRLGIVLERRPRD